MISRKKAFFKILDVIVLSLSLIGCGPSLINNNINTTTNTAASETPILQPGSSITSSNPAQTPSSVTPIASSGRIIGYLPGWKTPPSATSLKTAGYTHILVAFGVFSTTQPGQIVSAFDTVSKNTVNALRSAGIKVLLSLGGASTSIPNTSVDFHLVLSQASSSNAFQTTFIQSVENLISQYGFDGIDFDIEAGLNSGGTFSQPTGDIAVLANIINQLHTRNSQLLISLAPQVANISATSGFDQTWGNYSSLIMKTHASLSWVGIQLYNAGCAFGIDHVCYDPNATSSPDFSVAMATDLLESWPQKDSSGRSTGFQPYISYLSPSQVVLGYPAPNRYGASDGSPATPVSTIKRALQCLKSKTTGSQSCDSYIPPRNYGSIGGVFNWEVTYDQDNGFQFANGLKKCVIDGNCL
jgi:chitinase